MEDDSPRERSRGPSLVDDLLGRTRQFVTGMVADYVKRSVDDLLRFALGKSLRYAVSAALFILAAAFLLLGGAKGLIVSGLPPHLAYLVIGGVSLLAGVVLLKCCDPVSGKR